VELCSSGLRCRSGLLLTSASPAAAPPRLRRPAHVAGRPALQVTARASQLHSLQHRMRLPHPSVTQRSICSRHTSHQPQRLQVRGLFCNCQFTASALQHRRRWLGQAAASRAGLRVLSIYSQQLDYSGWLCRSPGAPPPAPVHLCRTCPPHPLPQCIHPWLRSACARREHA
jgi:hypothetical protein